MFFPAQCPEECSKLAQHKICILSVASVSDFRRSLAVREQYTCCRVLHAHILLFSPKRGTMHVVDRDSSESGDCQNEYETPLASPLRHQPPLLCTLQHYAHAPNKPHFASVPQQQLTVLSHSPEHKSYTLLASCMHAGSRIVRLEWLGNSAEGSGEWTFRVLAKFEEHKSMNYGSDVQPVQRGQEGGQRTIVSTSFYDKLMCVWQFGEQ
jgi:hypothetical protein